MTSCGSFDKFHPVMPLYFNNICILPSSITFYFIKNIIVMLDGNVQILFICNDVTGKSYQNCRR